MATRRRTLVIQASEIVGHSGRQASTQVLRHHRQVLPAGLALHTHRHQDCRTLRMSSCLPEVTSWSVCQTMLVLVAFQCLLGHRRSATTLRKWTDTGIVQLLAVTLTVSTARTTSPLTTINHGISQVSDADINQMQDTDDQSMRCPPFEQPTIPDMHITKSQSNTHVRL